MTRLATPDSIENAPQASRPLLEAVKKAFGSAPNLFRVIANSPAALEGALALSGALAKSALDAATRERIALAVSERNGCEYCLAAHSYTGMRFAKLDADEVEKNRSGRSASPKPDAALRFVVQLLETRGRVSDADVAAVRAAGYGDAEIVDMVAQVALTTFTNYVNGVARTEPDFPAMPTRE